MSGIFIISACLCILMLVILASLDRLDEPGVREWMLANAVAFVAFILYALGRQLPPLLAYEAANGTYALAMLAALAGFRRFSGRPVLLKAYAASLLVFVVAIALFHYWFDSFALRTITVSAFQTTILAAVARGVFQAKEVRHARYPALFTGSVATIFALGNAVRAVVHVAQADTVTSLLQPSPWSIFFISAGASVLPLLTFGAMMMVHDRLLAHASDVTGRDFLTGALTRDMFHQRLGREWKRSRSTGRKLAVLLIDVDRLQSIKRGCGDVAGDQVMVNIALQAESMFRASDCFARVAGTQFAALLPHTGPEMALKLAQRLAARVEKSALPAECPASQDGLTVCTVSIGLAALGDGESAPDLLARAQEALQAATAAGGNRIVCAGGTATTN